MHIWRFLNTDPTFAGCAGLSWAGNHSSVFHGAHGNQTWVFQSKTLSSWADAFVHKHSKSVLDISSNVWSIEIVGLLFQYLQYFAAALQCRNQVLNSSGSNLVCCNNFRDNPAAGVPQGQYLTNMRVNKYPFWPVLVYISILNLKIQMYLRENFENSTMKKELEQKGKKRVERIK